MPEFNLDDSDLTILVENSSFDDKDEGWWHCEPVEGRDGEKGDCVK